MHAPWAALMLPAALDGPTTELLSQLCSLDGFACEWRAPGVLVVPPVLDGPALEKLCEVLTVLDERALRQDPTLPNLYQSGAYYELRPEYWLSVPWALVCLSCGHGLDCKVLATWRCAELRVRRGERGARCVWSRHATPAKVVYHVRVRRADGRIEDPSARLGMRSVLPAERSA